MTKILRSVLVLALIAGIGGYVARSGAWFTDEEKVLGNTLDTGTIDIAVDGENPVSANRHYELKDLKPSQHGYIDEIVTNVGTNPLNLFKTVGEFRESELISSEPKCLALNGTWTGTDCTGEVTPTDLASRINYDLRVELYTSGGQKVWWETIYLDSDNKKLDALNKVYLGMVPPGWYMKVMQSYHMINGGAEDNKYQGEMLTFDMTFDAEQLGASPLPLVHKYLPNSNVSHHVYDGQGAVLSYVIRDRAFDYSLTTTGLPVGAYTLIAWDNSAHGYSWDWNNHRGEALVLGHITANGTATGVVDLNRSLTNAKVWLIPGTVGTVGSPVGPFGWNSTGIVFETGLMSYIDADL